MVGIGESVNHNKFISNGLTSTLHMIIGDQHQTNTSDSLTLTNDEFMNTKNV